MGGGRNGRFLYTVVALLFLGTVYVFYLYRGVRVALQEKEEELDRLEELQSRIGDQLNGVYCVLTYTQFGISTVHTYILLLVNV